VIEGGEQLMEGHRESEDLERVLGVWRRSASQQVILSSLHLALALR
jgi:hypothetical protein